HGSPILNATSSTLTLSNIDQSELGQYWVVAANNYGSVTSSIANLYMYPYIATPFTGIVANWGQPTTLSVGAWGSGTLTYQWYDNGNAIPDATNSTYTLSAIQFTNAGLYSVVVSSSLGSVTNAPAQVVVNPAGVSLGLYPGITVTGTVGYTYDIQSNPDLTNTNGWTTVATVTLYSPVQFWVDVSDNTTSPTNTHRFYRVLPAQ
ncbi:MAG TPA: immunoglobulin domain-containing protein, partial [Candidatus Saccharimonadales bacterium]|nr:immunoglobulin domain-containing protein [Candidatus Saccharimonadales bacterium]